MKERIKNLRAFLDAAHSVYHANAILRTLLEEDGSTMFPGAALLWWRSGFLRPRPRAFR